VTAYLAQKNGVDPASTHRIAVQSGATLLGTVQHGNVDGATSLCMTADYVDNHPDIMQKLVNAYVKAFDSEKGIYNPTGIMPPDGPATNLKVLQAFNPDVKGKSIDLSKTYTDKFVQAAK
jgi:NitT/TauT family transport system substrate-binding protein